MYRNSVFINYTLMTNYLFFLHLFLLDLLRLLATSFSSSEKLNTYVILNTYLFMIYLQMKFTLLLNNRLMRLIVELISYINICMHIYIYIYIYIYERNCVPSIMTMNWLFSSEIRGMGLADLGIELM